MLDTKFQASEPSASEEKNIFMYIWFKYKILLGRTILEPGAII